MNCASKSRKIEGGVSDDVVFTILQFVPVKDLCRFQRVCKSWREIICNRHFRQLHLQQSRRNPLLLIAQGKTDLYSLDKKGALIKQFSTPYNWSVKFKVLNTCLELICLHNLKTICVCNPTTEELFILPNKSSRTASRYMRKTFMVGFGYAPSTKQYKVISISYKTCDVFTIGFDQKWWRPAPDLPCAIDRYGFGEGAVYANGFIHIFQKSHRDGILRFDVEREEWSIIPSPPITDSLVFYLCQLGGLLCVVERVRERFGEVYMTIKINIWLLKDYENIVWVKEYTNFDLGNTEWSRAYPLLTEDGGILMKLQVQLGYSFNRFYEKFCYFDAFGNLYKEIESPVRKYKPTSSSLYVESFLSIQAS